MEHHPLLNFYCNPFPGYIFSGRVVYGPDQKHPERIFSTFVAMFIEEGILYFTEGEQTFTLMPGQWFIQTPGIRHYGHRAAGIRTVFHFVHFLPQADWHIENDEMKRESVLSRTMQLDSGEGVRLPQYVMKLPMRGTYGLHSDWFELFHKLQQDVAPGKGVLNKQACFLELLERMIEPKSIKEGSHASIQSALAYIRQHFSEPLTVSDLAARFHFSPDYLTRQIKKIAGATPASLIALYRINKAKQLLVHTSNSVQQIGLDSGYPDMAVFSRTFKKMTGLSPLKYRQVQWGKP
jgi:AraC-like DNA-binding protein/quercetin dioxygenase-like cupin family protein